MNFSLTDLLRLIGVTSITLPLTCASVGCQSDMTVQEKMELTEKIVEIGERHNVSYGIDIESSGFPRFEAGSYVGANTGVAVRAHIQGNAANSRLDPKPKPFNEIETMEPTVTEGGE